jgi:hypothetical protein
MSSMSSMSDGIKWKGPGGPEHFREVLQRVIFFAYGPMRKQRIDSHLNRERRLDSSGGSFVAFPKCFDCGIPSNGYSMGNGCQYCIRSQRVAPIGVADPTVPTAPEPLHQQFFAQLGRYLIALRVAYDAFFLSGLANWLVVPRKMVRCHGCDTFAPSKSLPWSGEGHLFCRRHRHVETSTTHAVLVWCGQPWCRAERMGVMRCSKCRGLFCGLCVKQCRICNQAAACGECYKAFRCERCSDAAGDTYCVWHCPARGPINVLDEHVYLVCREHRVAAEEEDRFVSSCPQCAQDCTQTFCSGGKPRCKNTICPHTSDGDARCRPCQTNVKRLKTLG